MSNRAKVPGTKPRKASSKPRGLQGGTSEANRLAVVILEVLAGERTPAEAAQVLGVATPRYYQLESRALQGLMAALEPRPQGKQPSPQRRIAKLEKALDEARREGLRLQALVRAAQRGLGIKTPTAINGKASDKDGSGRKKRRPAVRALKAARALAKLSRPPEGELLQPEDHGVRLTEGGSDSNGVPPAGARGASEGAGG